MTINILHTSDWHLGRQLYGQKRYAEFEAFLDGLVANLSEHQIDVLLIAGDIFDTSTPSNQAQNLYYNFLQRVAGSSCRHVVVIGGNHDSPTFLDAPRSLLKALNVHVVGQVADNPAEDVLLLRDADGLPELIVCAIPYLRDRDLRTAGENEALEDKDHQMLEGLQRIYAQAGSAALKLRDQWGNHLPIIGMGHLFAAGGKVQEGDGVRELYVGSLAQVGRDVFPACFDYLALGHLHVPQLLSGEEHLRYSGSPLAMGFGEARQQKSLCKVSFDAKSNQPLKPQISLINIPSYQALEQIRGSMQVITQRIKALKEQDQNIWLEVIHQDQALVPNLRSELEALVAGTQLQLLKITDQRVINQVLQQQDIPKPLEELNPEDVFEHCLQQSDIADEQRESLRHSFLFVMRKLAQDDPLAE